VSDAPLTPYEKALNERFGAGFAEMARKEKKETKGYPCGCSNKGLNYERQLERMFQAGVSPERLKTFSGKANQLRGYIGAYSSSPEKLGNQKGKTYLSEMLKVYGQALAILKPGVAWL